MPNGHGDETAALTRESELARLKKELRDLQRANEANRRVLREVVRKLAEWARQLEETGEL